MGSSQSSNTSTSYANLLRAELGERKLKVYDVTMGAGMSGGGHETTEEDLELFVKTIAKALRDNVGLNKVKIEGTVKSIIKSMYAAIPDGDVKVIPSDIESQEEAEALVEKILDEFFDMEGGAKAKIKKFAGGVAEKDRYFNIAGKIEEIKNRLQNILDLRTITEKLLENYSKTISNSTERANFGVIKNIVTLMLKESDREEKLLTTLLDVGDIEKRDYLGIMKKNNEVKRIINKTFPESGTKQYSMLLSKVLGEFANVAYNAYLVDEFLKRYGVTKGEYAKLKYSELEDKLMNQVKKKDLKDGDFAKLINALSLFKKVDGVKGDILKQIGGEKKGGAYKSYSKRVKEKRQLKDQTFKMFKNRMESHFKKILCEAKCIATKIPKEIPVTPELEEFVTLYKNLGRLDEIGVLKSLVGFSNDIKSLEKSDTYRNKVSRVIIQAERVHNQHITQFASLFKEFLDMVDSYKGTLKKVSQSNEVYITGGAAEMFEESSDVLSYHMDLGKLEKQMERAIKEFKQNTEEFDVIIGESIKGKLDMIQKECEAKKVKYLKEIEAVEASATASDKVKAWAKCNGTGSIAFQDKIKATKQNFWKAVGAIEIYIKELNGQLLSDRKVLDSLEDIIKPLTLGIYKDTTPQWNNIFGGKMDLFYRAYEEYVKSGNIDGHDDFERVFHWTEVLKNEGDIKPSFDKILEYIKKREYEVGATISKKEEIGGVAAKYDEKLQYFDITEAKQTYDEHFKYIKQILGMFFSIANKEGRDELWKRTGMSPMSILSALNDMFFYMSLEIDTKDSVKTVIKPNRQHNSGVDDIFKKERPMFKTLVKAMSAKVSVVVGVYNIYNRPNGYNRFTPARLMLGGEALGIPKTHSKNIAVYIRLTLLAEAYKHMFNPAGKDWPGLAEYKNEEKDIAFIPEMENTPFAEFVNLMWRRVAPSSNGKYSSHDIARLVKCINSIVDVFNTSTESEIASHFIKEVNQRYGLVDAADSKILRDELDEVDYADEYSDAHKIPGENDDTIYRQAPWDVLTVGERKEESKYAIGDNKQLVYRFMDRLFGFLHQETPSSAYSYTKYLEVLKKEHEAATTDEDKFDVVIRGFNNIGDNKDLHSIYKLMKVEFVDTPLAMLTYILEDLKKCATDLNNCEMIDDIKKSTFDATRKLGAGRTVLDVVRDYGVGEEELTNPIYTLFKESGIEKYDDIKKGVFPFTAVTDTYRLADDTVDTLLMGVDAPFVTKHEPYIKGYIEHHKRTKTKNAAAREILGIIEKSVSRDRYDFDLLRGELKNVGDAYTVDIVFNALFAGITSETDKLNTFETGPGTKNGEAEIKNWIATNILPKIQSISIRPNLECIFDTSLTDETAVKNELQAAIDATLADAKVKLESVAINRADIENILNELRDTKLKVDTYGAGSPTSSAVSDDLGDLVSTELHVRRFVEIITRLNRGKLIKVDIKNKILDISKLRDAVEQTLEQVKQFINILDVSIDIPKEHGVYGSYYYIKEELEKKFFAGSNDEKALNYKNLQKRLFELCDDYTGKRITIRIRNPSTNTVEGYEIDAIDIVASRFISGAHLRKTDNSSLGSRIYKLDSKDEKAHTGMNKSIMKTDDVYGLFDKFNHLSFSLIRESYDWLSDSIYSKIIYSLTSGKLTDEISQPKKSKRDHIYSKVDLKEKMLYSSLASLLSKITSANPKKKVVVHDFEKIIDPVKEKLRIVIPYFTHAYRDLISEVTLYEELFTDKFLDDIIDKELLNKLQQFAIVFALTGVSTADRNNALKLIIAGKVSPKLQLEITAVGGGGNTLADSQLKVTEGTIVTNIPLTEFNTTKAKIFKVAKLTFSDAIIKNQTTNVVSVDGTKLDPFVEEGDLKAFLSNVKSYSMNIINDLANIGKELDDSPLSFQTSSNFITNYKSENKKNPFMPHSASIAFLKEKVFPYCKVGTTEFKYLFGTRVAFASKFDVDRYLGAKNILKEFNTMSKKRIEDKTLSNELIAMSELIQHTYSSMGFDSKHNKDVFGTVKNAYTNSDNNLIYPLSHELNEVILKIESTSIEKGMFEYIEGQKKSSDSNTRRQILARNVIDMNVNPINIHALYRQCPLNGIYTYSYNGDVQIYETLTYERHGNPMRGIRVNDNKSPFTREETEWMANPPTTSGNLGFGFMDVGLNTKYAHEITDAYIKFMVREKNENLTTLNSDFFFNSHVFTSSDFFKYTIVNSFFNKEEANLVEYFKPLYTNDSSYMIDATKKLASIDGYIYGNTFVQDTLWMDVLLNTTLKYLRKQVSWVQDEKKKVAQGMIALNENLNEFDEYKQRLPISFKP